MGVLLTPEQLKKLRYEIKGQPYNSTGNQVHKLTCPDDEVWEVIEVGLHAIDASTRSVVLNNKNAKGLMTICSKASGTGAVLGPSGSTDVAYKHGSRPLLVYPDEYLTYTFGTAQTTGGDFIWIKYLKHKLEELSHK